jgi:hypothetical protein
MRFAIVLRTVSIFQSISLITFIFNPHYLLLRIGNFARSYHPQVICHSSRFVSNGLYTFKSKGKIDKVILQSNKVFLVRHIRSPPHTPTKKKKKHTHTHTNIIVWTFIFLYEIFLFAGNRAYGGRCNVKS